MFSGCETAGRITIPAIRMAAARALIERHHMSQSRAAELLGVRQASISNYMRMKRSGRILIVMRAVVALGLEQSLVRMAVEGAGEARIAEELERISSDPRLARLTT